LCVSSVVFMGRETGLLQLLAPLLLTGEKGADLVIRGNVVLNTDQRAKDVQYRVVLVTSEPGSLRVGHAESCLYGQFCSLVLFSIFFLGPVLLVDALADLGSV
jgi:hypothetical protein